MPEHMLEAKNMGIAFSMGWHQSHTVTNLYSEAQDPSKAQ